LKAFKKLRVFWCLLGLLKDAVSGIKKHCAIFAIGSVFAGLMAKMPRVSLLFETTPFSRLERHNESGIF
jgi:hypothetical protein